MRARALLPLLLLFGAPSCGKEVARVKLSDLGDTQVEAVRLSAGTEVHFPVHVDEYSYSGRNYIIVKAELLDDDAVVAKLECRGFEFEGGSGAGCGATHQSSACSIEVPKGGADAVRITTSLDDPSGDVDVEGLAVGIRVSE